ncbi:hypothetical protein vBKpnPMUC100_030 [Klebsiella phage vB_KpnP_MUC100]|uniref:Uncharacterized protein n=1 Tax=Klebsiella phage vB_KpnP_MUC100 TaxID=3065244 RepID=A0AAX4G467_9CAUD|nr:hypothetical protein vBKpnPMUC100_030 [Klebsiella phage vB_KpnP_MUC100]
MAVTSSDNTDWASGCRGWAVECPSSYTMSITSFQVVPQNISYKQHKEIQHG